MPKRKPSDSALTQVVLLPEATRLWQKNRKTIDLAIAKGQLAARQSGRNWLISVASLTERWGPPCQPVPSE